MLRRAAHSVWANLQLDVCIRDGAVRRFYLQADKLTVGRVMVVDVVHCTDCKDPLWQCDCDFWLNK